MASLPWSYEQEMDGGGNPMHGIWCVYANKEPDEQGWYVATVTSREAAAFIVKAVNCHDELCEAVDAALGHVRGEGPPNWDWLREVLKRARGEQS